MPYKRKDSPHYYIDLRLTDGRRLNRSTRATSKKLATRIESTIRDLEDKGRAEILDALCEGRVTPREVYRARQLEMLEELKEGSENPPLSETIQRFERAVTSTGVTTAMDALREVAPTDARTSWLLDPDNLQAVAHRYRDRGLAAGTERRNMMVVSGLLRHAFGPETRDRLWRKVHLRDADNRRRVWLTPEEMAAVEEVSTDRMWALISTAASTGLRSGELMGLVGQDIDPDRNLLIVRSGKSRSAERQVPLYGRPLATLVGWMDETNVGPRDRVWPDLNTGKVSYRWAKIRDALELTTAEGDPVRFHDLRHHFAVHMAREGVPLTELRDLLGHSTLDMVERYAIYTPLPDADRFEAGYRSMGLVRGPARESRQNDRQERQEAR